MDGGSTFFGRNPVFFLGGVTYYNGRRKYFFSDRNPVFEVGYLIIMDGGSTFLAEILYFGGSLIIMDRGTGFFVFHPVFFIFAKST